MLAPLLELGLRLAASLARAAAAAGGAAPVMTPSFFGTNSKATL